MVPAGSPTSPVEIVVEAGLSPLHGLLPASPGRSDGAELRERKRRGDTRHDDMRRGKRGERMTDGCKW